VSIRESPSTPKTHVTPWNTQKYTQKPRMDLFSVTYRNYLRSSLE
jgi:hypothetical protein